MARTKWPETILHGIHIGEHSFQEDRIKDEIKTRCIDAGMNYVVIRPNKKQNIPEEYFVEWARYLAENQIYFMFLYTIKATRESKVSRFSEETVNRIREAAGEYFLGDVLGEPGSHYTFKEEGYFTMTDALRPMQGVKDLAEAEGNYCNFVNQFAEADKVVGIDEISCVEAMMFSKYDLKAGVTIPILEMMVGDPECLIAGVRGAAKSYQTRSWGTYLAHEWYGGRHHEDLLKQKRLQLTYKYAYLAGSNIFCLESGDEMLDSYGTVMPYEHELCRQYRELLTDFNQMIHEDQRPQGGPKVKVAFVYGHHDGWSGVPMGSHVWGQFEGREWGYSDAEYSWRILEDVNRGIAWSDFSHHGEADFGAMVPYGQYDIIPADTPVDQLKQYELVIFAGWNTMTEEIYENMKAYVQAGGKLLLTAAHLNTSKVRDGQRRLLRDGAVEDLFGCRLGEGFVSKKGFKFVRESMLPGMKYSGACDYHKDSIDPFWHAGYAEYARAQMMGGRIAAVADNSFAPTAEAEEIALVEHHLGEGYVFLMTTLEYPGANAVYPLYRLMVQTLISHLHNECDVQVLASDKCKFAVYEGDVVYLLNTDYHCPVAATVIRGGVQDTYLLQPGELKRV